MLAPFRVAPRFVARAWGSGDRLRRLGLAAPPGTGEAWLVSDVPGSPSVVEDGPYAGRTLRDVSQEARGDLFGAALLALDPTLTDFPLLVKLLDVDGPLSVQVHPDGPTARALGDGPRGKSEAWLLLDAGSNARVAAGLRAPLEAAAVVELARAGGLDEALAPVEAAPGTGIELLWGVVHTARDVLALEVQETADVTYRVFDFGRGRALHLEQARRVLERMGPASPRLVRAPAPGGQARTAVASGRAPFTFDVLDLAAGESLELGDPWPGVLVVLAGSATLASGATSLSLATGASAVLPADAPARVVARGPCRLAHALARAGDPAAR